MPSLENLSAVNIAIRIWKNDLHYVKNDAELKKTSEARLSQMANALDLPENLKSKMNILIKQISLEVDAWFRFHENNNSMSQILTNDVCWDDYRILNNIIWTNAGSINIAATAQSLISSSLLTVAEQFNLACNYCLMNTIYELTPKVVSPEYLGEIVPSFHPLPYFWTCVAAGDLYKLNRYPAVTAYDSDEDYYGISVEDINFAEIAANWHVNLKLQRTSMLDENVELIIECDTANYTLMIADLLDTYDVYTNESAYMFFWKLLPKERRYVTYSDCGAKAHPHSLLLHMDEEEQRHFIAHNGRYLLRDCLSKPTEVNYILEMMNYVMDTPSGLDFYGILKEILWHLKYFQLTSAYHSYLYIVEQFIQRVPQSVRLEIMNLKEVPEGLEDLIRFEEESSVNAHFYVIRLLLNGADERLQQKLFNSEYGKQFCITAINANRFNDLDKMLPSGIDLFDIPFTKFQLLLINTLLMNKTRECISKLESFPFSDGESFESVGCNLPRWSKIMERLKQILETDQIGNQLDVVRSLMKEFWQMIKPALFNVIMILARTSEN